MVLSGEKRIAVNSLIVAQKPYTKRRAYAILNGFGRNRILRRLRISHPDINFANYSNRDVSPDELIKYHRWKLPKNKRISSERFSDTAGYSRRGLGSP